MTNLFNRNDGTFAQVAYTDISGSPSSNSAGGVFNVKDFGALGDNSNDDTTAIQTAVNSASAVTSGTVFFPPGNYVVTSTITVPNGVRLLGSGVDGTLLNGGASNHLTLDFTGNGRMEWLFVAGYLNSGASTATVRTATNTVCTFRDCYIWGGLYGLHVRGHDGCFTNCFISAWASTGAHIYSNDAANWFMRCKFDDSGVAVAQGLKMDGATGIVESHFDMCDFSGSFTSTAVSINDSDKTHLITGFTNCVFSSAVTVTNAKATQFANCEFGSTIGMLNSSIGTFVGNYSFISNAISSGTVTVAGNFQIS